MTLAEFSPLPLPFPFAIPHFFFTPTLTPSSPSNPTKTNFQKAYPIRNGVTLQERIVLQLRRTLWS